jgi:hypothetical protein
MTFKNFLRVGSGTALVAAMLATASPSMAQDGNGHGRWRDRATQQSSDGERTTSLPQARQQWQERRAAAAAQPVQPAPQQQQRAWTGQQAQAAGRNQSEMAQARAGRQWNRRDNSSNDWGQARAAQAQAHAQAQAQQQVQAGSQYRRYNGGSAGVTTRSGEWQRNRSYADGQRNQSYRTQQQYTQQQYQQQRYQQQRQDGYRDGQRYNNAYRDGSRYGTSNGWNRDWRQDNRYDWYSYRNSNRNIYRLGQYYSPYRNYSYSRIGIGFSLDRLFFGSNYWINNPYQYRLPAAYGPYRWVRYYDDAQLVDIYSGQVVDVIYSFFW